MRISIQNKYNYGFSGRKAPMDEESKAYYRRTAKYSKYTDELPKWKFKYFEGIQEGLESFKGMKIKNIFALLRNLTVIATIRNCSSNCSDCCENAQKPPTPADFKRDKKLTRMMPWEQYEQTISDIGELSDRVGIDLLNTRSNWQSDATALFLDSDSIYYRSKDKNGVVKDAADAAELYLEKLKKRSLLITTAGVVQSDSRTQEVITKLNDVINKHPKRVQLNISINEFHNLMQASQKALEEGNIEKSMRYRELYTNRMANTIFQFIPAIENCEYFSILTTWLDKESVFKLKDEIAKKVEEKALKNDLELPAKLVKSLNTESGRKIRPLGKAIKLYGITDPPNADEMMKIAMENEIDLNKFYKILDANGQFYITNELFTSKIDNLRLKSKNLKTPEITKATKKFGAKIIRGELKIIRRMK